jgi:hypothetical protein
MYLHVRLSSALLLFLRLLILAIMKGFALGFASHLLRTDNAIEEDPSNNTDGKICNNLSPNHIDILTPPWSSVPQGMLDCLPDRQKPEAECEPSSQRGYLDIRR